jgi:uncharacterized phage protein (TIGR01671 family)
MREIKFRVWNKRTGAWLHPSSFRLDGYGKIWLNDIVARHVEEDGDLEVEQFTGLHDKNGREIYEGYIIRQGWPYEGVIGDVTWDDKGSGFIPFTEPGLGGQEWESANPKTCEVIGNVHENPELLK